MKRGQVASVNVLAGVAVTLVVVGIVAVVGLEIMEDTGEDVESTNCEDAGGYWNSTSNVCQTNSSSTTALQSNSAAFNATTDATTGIAKIPSKLPLIVTAVVGAVLIGIVVTFLLVRAR